MAMSRKLRRSQAECLAVQIANAKRRGIDPVYVGEMISAMDELVGYWSTAADHRSFVWPQDIADLADEPQRGDDY